MTNNPKIAFYRERFHLPLVDYDQDPPLGEAVAMREYRLSAIRSAIADLRGDLAQVNQIIRVLEWLTTNPPPEKS